jgi:hypothetical protein
MPKLNVLPVELVVHTRVGLPPGVVSKYDQAVSSTPPETPPPQVLTIVQYPPEWLAGIAYAQIAPAPGFVRVLVEGFSSPVPLDLAIFIQQQVPGLHLIGRGVISVNSSGYYDVPIDTAGAAFDLVVAAGTLLRAALYTPDGQVYVSSPSYPIAVFEPSDALMYFELGFYNTEPQAYGFNLNFTADRALGTYRLKYWPSLVNLTLAEFYGTNHPLQPTYFIHDAAVDQAWFHLLYVVNNAHHGESWVLWHDETASVVSNPAAVPLNNVVL